MNKIKFHQLKVITLNGTKHYGYLLHQLPKKYHEIDTKDIIKMRGYVYIHESNFNNIKMVIDCLTSNKDINYKEKR